MATRNWYVPDDSRSSWAFLLTGADDLNAPFTSDIDEIESTSGITFWELGIGNADTLVNTTAAGVGYGDICSEKELLSDLLNTLEKYRYQGTILITPSGSEIRSLRRCLATTEGINQPSLRGFSHLHLEHQLNQYFNQTLSDYDFQRERRKIPREKHGSQQQITSSESLREFCQIWNQVFSLLPATELRGEKL
jgi:hypothetical protein